MVDGRVREPVVAMDTMRVQKPWGRRRAMPPFDGGNGNAASSDPVGEIWFQCEGRQLDLMVKYISTSEKLSIQVHPSDEQARALGHRQGKEECWYILDAEPGATVGIGTLAPLNPAQLEAACRSGEIDHLMDWIPVHQGDFFYIPAGTVHAIGAGIALIEIQQNADITYRLYDYGRQRELHLQQGIEVARPRPYPACMRRHVAPQQPAMLVDGPHFRLAVSNGSAPVFEGIGPYYAMQVQDPVEMASGIARPGRCMLADDPAAIVALPGTRLIVARSCGPSAGSGTGKDRTDSRF